MKYKPVGNPDDPFYGYIFELDFREYFEKNNINYDEYDALDDNHHNWDSKLPFSKLRVSYKEGDVSMHPIRTMTAELATWELLDKMVNHDKHTQEKFLRLWPFRSADTHLEWFNQSLNGGGGINFDMKGFSLHKHVDNRFIFGNIIINLEDNEDNTTFWNSNGQEMTYKASGEKGMGTLFINCEHTLHQIEVLFEERRVTYNLPMILNTF